MEHVNTTTTRQQQQQQQQQQQLQQHQLEQQQQHHENQQQFCLRWHNHQTSLLSTLPVLLDQSHLTDVTISAEGRTLRAHRVVLSACSSFFMELFRTLESNNHPVIIIPGATFGAIVALLTFMYSGEVNVYEEQIPTLLNLAETLGIKGLADVPNNVHNNNNNKRPAEYFETLHKETKFERPITPSTPPTLLLPNTQTPTQALLSNNVSAQVPSLTAPSLLTNKLANCTPLENLFLKSLQFYPNLLPQPLNFSQTALNKTTELLAKYQQQCNLYQGVFAKDFMLENEDGLRHTLAPDDSYGVKRLCAREKLPIQIQQTVNQGTNSLQQNTNQLKDIKRIDKIVENLRGPKSNESPSPQLSISTPHQATTPTTTATPQSMQQYTSPLTMKSSPNYTATGLTISQHLYNAKPPLYTSTTSAAPLQASSQPPANLLSAPYITPEDHAKLQQHMEQYAACNREVANAANAATLCVTKSEPNLLALTEKMTAQTSAASAPPTKPPSNSKLYATCFICHKQLSNQYNLRVHLETHQNVRYACNVCSHVSRSKDALRKHVSYRHPGAPSPCETDARRKRVSKLSGGLHGAQTPTTASSVEAIAAPTTTSASTSVGYTPAISDATQLHQLSGNNPYLFLPNQFHLAAAAAAAAAETAAAATGPAMGAAISNTAQTPATSAIELMHNALPSTSTVVTELIKKEQNGDANVASESLSLPTLPSSAS